MLSDAGVLLHEPTVFFNSRSCVCAGTPQMAPGHCQTAVEPRKIKPKIGRLLFKFVLQLVERSDRTMLSLLHAKAATAPDIWEEAYRARQDRKWPRHKDEPRHNSLLPAANARGITRGRPTGRRGPVLGVWTARDQLIRASAARLSTNCRFLFSVAASTVNTLALRPVYPLILAPSPLHQAAVLRDFCSFNLGPCSNQLGLPSPLPGIETYSCPTAHPQLRLRPKSSPSVS